MAGISRAQSSTRGVGGNSSQGAHQTELWQRPTSNFTHKHLQIYVYRNAPRSIPRSRPQQAGTAAVYRHNHTDPHHHLDQQSVRVHQHVDVPVSRLLAERAREDYRRRRDEVRHMHQILDRISGQGSVSASRGEQVMIWHSRHVSCETCRSGGGVYSISCMAVVV